MLQPTAKTIDRKVNQSINERVERASQVVSPQTQWRILVALLIVNDTLALGIALLLAYLVRFNLDLSIFQLDALSNYDYYQQISFILIPIWLILFAVNGLYQHKKLLGGTEEYALVFRATSFGTLIIIIFSFLLPEFVLARGWLLFAWLFTFLLVTIGRFAIRRLVYASRQHGYFLAPALIVGGNKEGRALAEQLMSWRTSGLNIIGFIDQNFALGTKVYGDLQCLGHFEQLEKVISRYKVGELIISNSAISRDEMLSIFRNYGMADGVNLHLSSGLFEIITTGMDVKEFAYVPLVRVRKARLTGIDRLLKLLLDYTILVIGFIFILPLLFVIGLAVKLDSAGPIIHKRRVLGLNGSQFDAFKFRTMYVDGDKILAQYPDLQRKLAQDRKLKDDPRITRVGYFLRKTSLDELPQFFNVLKRDMSLVGPRIIAPDEVSEYGDWDMNLLTVPPGITGLWQVSGRSDLPYEKRVQLDMHYIRNWSIWLDLQILWQTIPAVIKGRGAY